MENCCQNHGKCCGQQGLQGIDELIAEPAEPVLGDSAQDTLREGGLKTQTSHHRSHQDAANGTGQGSLKTDRPFSSRRNRLKGGDQHGGAAPALADLTAEGVRQLGRETGGKAYQEK